MSGATIIAATLSILKTEVGTTFPLIADIDAVQIVNGTPAIAPQDTPAIVVQLNPAPEVPVTFGRNRIEQDEDLHIWQVTDTPPTADGADAFKALVADVMVRLRSHPKLDGLANIPGTSAVLIASRRLRVQFTRPIVRPSQVWYHAVITDRIQEFVQSPIS